MTLGDNDDWNDHMEMLDLAFAEHYPVKVIQKDDVLKVAKINNMSYNFVAADDYIIPSKSGGGTDAEIVTHMAVNVYAPINAGEKVGYADILCRGEKVGSVDIISESNIYSAGGITLINSFMNTFTSVVRKILI